MKGVLKMQDTTDPRDNLGIRESCASCGGDPGGLVWEGVILTGALTAADLARLAPGAIDHRGAVRLFATGKIRGVKIGKCWVTTASRFIEDWQLLEKRSRRVRQKRQRRRIVVDVAAR
jgi:hypothetical protein